MLRAYFRATGPARTTTRTRAPTAAEVAASLQGLYRCDAGTVEFRLAARYEWLPSAQGPSRYLTEQAEGTLTLSRQEPFPRLDALTGERLDARWSEDACEREPLQ